MIKLLQPAFTTYLSRLNDVSRCVKLFSKISSQRYIMTKTHFSKLPIRIVEVPTMGDSITEGTIVDIPISRGKKVRADEVVMTLETDKVSIDVRAPEAGSIQEIMNKVDDVVQVGDTLFTIDTDQVDELPYSKKILNKTMDETESTSSSTGPTDPNSNLPSTGAVKNSLSSPTVGKIKSNSSQNSISKIRPSEKRAEQRVKMSRMRLRVAARLKDAQNTAAMLTTFQEVDMSNLIDMRNNYKDIFQSKHGVKLGFMSSFVKSATAALKEIGVVNAYIDDGSKEIVYRDYFDISVAVASPNGLVVPVLRNTETMTFADIERSVAMYSEKAKNGTLSLDEMTGGTFTISNGGVFGSLMGMPIINPPQSAILGMHATKLRPIVNKHGQVVARPMMYLALTYDHRLIDGREGVSFLKSIAEKIEHPSHLLLDI